MKSRLVKTHYELAGSSLCFTGGNRHIRPGSLKCTTVRADVTCKICLHWMSPPKAKYREI